MTSVVNGRSLAEPARDKEGGPFMPQTVLLRLEADRGFGTISDTRRSRDLLAEWNLGEID